MTHPDTCTDGMRRGHNGAHEYLEDDQIMVFKNPWETGWHATRQVGPGETPAWVGYDSALDAALIRARAAARAHAGGA